MSAIELLIFAKYPEPGEVMTRLCPPLTHEEAASVQRACVRLLCERAFRSWPVRPKLIVTPDDCEDRFREITGPYVPMIPQGDGNLGSRLLRAGRRALDSGCPEVILIGSDSPTLPASLIADARAALGDADVVLGPCDDGGVYLIGLRAVHPNMFDGVEWSTDQVAVQMEASVARAGLAVKSIGNWYDVDRPEDLKRALEDVVAGDALDDFELRQVLETVLSASAERRRGANS